MIKFRKKAQFFNKTKPLHQQHNFTNFQEQLEADLLAGNLQQDQFLKVLEQFESIYCSTKGYRQMIEIQRKKKQHNTETLKQLKKRIVYLTQANQQNRKNSKNIAAQTQKIKENFTLNKILMMEKIVKLQRETEDIRHKKDNYLKVRNQRILRSEHKKNLKQQQHKRIRMKSMNQSRSLKIELESQKVQNLENNKQVVRNVKSEKQRLRRKTIKIQEFKRKRAFQNYLEKVIMEKQKIQERELMLQKVTMPEITRNKPIENPKKPTPKKTVQEQLYSFFTTQANSLENK